ncbi:tryptophan halogenase family protein [Amphiplicatus metriothermophilus]|uniref:Tryptophan halogenase n=1 Tax=Amphiplicatus metriothermophilus TaxID=1519374 RepID=A0A239PQG2_9PROT|nr:tryptophan halogenase family protein [Amphiplicatus metriothermophilus]MBB5518479.1 tryptophan halogenase [Amphiplicatus metriothermophilus]SNT72360.1 tryptophan halogenase [Amphiplicatus metriothermophilus]
MSQSRPRKKVIIAGGGTAGWMAAAAIGKTLGKIVDVTLVESDAIATVGVGEATIPTLVTYNRLLGIDEAKFMSAVGGTFKLGIAFENWTDLGHRYIHSFGVTGKDHWTAGFAHFWRRGREMGIARDFGDYCLELVAAERERFAHLPDLGLNYAFHLDSTAYAAFLRNIAEEHGVVRKEGRICGVRRKENGDLQALVLEGGTALEGDLFLDCSGFRALLIGETLGVGYDDWTHWLPCDRAIAVQTKSTRPPVPYTRSIAHEAGWQWRIPLQHRTGNGIVFCSRYMSEDEARERLLSSIEGEILTEPRVIRFRAGARRAHWHRNCVSIGLSSGFIEPLESTSIHLIQRSVIRLMQMFPHGDVEPSDVTEFNKQTFYELEHIRDFIILHYHLTNRTDTEFWRHCRNMDIPDGLKHRMRLFSQTGRAFKANDELFAENSWTQVMLGQGLLPKTYHPVADVMSEEELARFLAHVEGNVARTVESLPAHEAYLKTYCPVKAPA